MTEAQSAAEQTNDVAPSSHGSALLRNRFRIDAATPLSQFDTAAAKAFAASDRRDPDRCLFALICDPHLPVRSHAMSRLKKTSPSGLLPLIDRGTVNWPPANRRCLAVIYPLPAGGTLPAAFADRGNPISEYELPRRIIAPLTKGLRGLETLGLSHRNVRPDNLFFLDEGKEEPVFGDCVTAPAGFNQPAVLEPIERAMALPAGRGEGEIADDLYALGVSLVILVLGRNPLAAMGSAQVISAKIEKGSYATLCDRQRIPLPLIEPLRGLLSDDPEQRWGLDEVERWLGGQNLALPPHHAVSRPPAIFTFADVQYGSLRTLARAFVDNVGEAARVIRGGQLETWLRQRRKEEDLANAIAEAAAAANAGEGLFRLDDFLVARAAVILDPTAPIRYRGLHFMADGFGPALAISWLRDGDAQIPAEVISLDLLGRWLKAQRRPGVGAYARKVQFKKLRSYLEDRRPGAGLERCLYEMNPGLPCQSPIVVREHVLDIGGLLLSLESAAGNGGGETLPVDRHIAAFVAARWDNDIQPFMVAFSDSRSSHSVLGVLGLLARLQQESNTPPLPRLSGWIGEILGPVLDSYHSRNNRKEIEGSLFKVARSGDLSALYELVNNRERRQADHRGFVTAASEYAAIETEIQEINGGSEARANSSRQAAQKSAAAISVLISTLVAIIVVMIRI